MLTNVESVDSLRGLAREMARVYVTSTVSPLYEEQFISDGWEILRKNKRSTRLMKKKPHGRCFENRVWTLLYRLGFPFVSGRDGATLQLNPKDPDSPTSQIDVVGIDDEVAIAIECKSSEKFTRRPQFQEELGKHSLIREQFANSVNRQFQAPHKRQIALAMFTSQIGLSDNDRKRAQEAKVVLFDEKDLNYYEDLVQHLGPAARYQFLADLLPGKTIPGLTLRVPAIRTKMGGFYCYTFSVTPSYLLKIGFVSHRAKGKASDVDTYQRMIKKSRLRKIREYIEDDGIFPTNIVINFEKKPTFHQIEQDAEQQSGKMGWLELRPSYKSAWIIDGQHRLFAYSGSPQAETARLAVLALERIPPSKQAELFIDINAQQKSVKQSLLQELYAELHWDAQDPALRVSAIISKTIQTLDEDQESPFFNRILNADERRDFLRCITLNALFGALDHQELFLSIARRGGPPEYGPFWAGDSSEATRKRTAYVLNNWFGTIKSNAEDWWSLGSGAGGGLAMNDGVAACIAVLRSVFEHLDASGEKLSRLDDSELVDRVRIYGDALGDYLGSLSEDDRRWFRDLRGVQGVTARTRHCQQAIHEQVPSFDPPGLQEFIELEKAQTNRRAKDIVDRIEVALQQTIFEELRREFSLDEGQWWMEGIPRAVRTKASIRFNEDDGKAGGPEHYLDLIDYRTIIAANWELFNSLLGYGKASSGKEKRTGWLNDVNEVRRIVSHASSGKAVGLEQLAQLEEYDGWLTKQISSPQRDDPEAGESME